MIRMMARQFSTLSHRGCGSSSYILSKTFPFDVAMPRSFDSLKSLNSNSDSNSDSNSNPGFKDSNYQPIPITIDKQPGDTSYNGQPTNIDYPLSIAAIITFSIN